MNTESSSNDQGGLGHAADTEGARIRARRNFLKGTSLALPAAMTLTPGTAQALASITCGQKALDSNLTATALVSDDDGLYRQSVDVYDRLIPGVDGNNNPVMVPNNIPTYFLDTVQAIWRDAGGAAIGAEPADKGPNVVTMLAIVHIDATNGAPVAVGSGTNPTNAIITSAAGACMASLMQQTM